MGWVGSWGHRPFPSGIQEALSVWGEQEIFCLGGKCFGSPAQRSGRLREEVTLTLFKKNRYGERRARKWSRSEDSQTECEVKEAGRKAPGGKTGV